MGLPAPLVEEIADFARTAQAPPSLTPKERLLLTLEELATHTRLVKERSDQLRQHLTEFVEALPSTPQEVDDLDRLVDVLRLAELDTKDKLAPAVKKLKLVRKDSFSLPKATPGERARAIAIIDRYEVVL